MLGKGVCGSRPRNGEIKIESSVVPVAFETCKTSVVLNSCRTCGSFQMSLRNWIEARWKWDRGRRFCNS